MESREQVVDYNNGYDYALTYARAYGVAALLYLLRRSAMRETLPRSQRAGLCDGVLDVLQRRDGRV